jgi:hypothetical protein
MIFESLLQKPTGGVNALAGISYLRVAGPFFFYEGRKGHLLLCRDTFFDDMILKYRKIYLVGLDSIILTHK